MAKSNESDNPLVFFAESGDQLSERRKTFVDNINKHVFVIMRYGSERPFGEIEKTIRDTLNRYGLEAILARDIGLHELLWDNVRFCMDYSRYAIAVFENIIQPDFNPNVTLELGYMLALKRPCLILKERSMPHLSTDVIGHLYEQFNSYIAKETIEVAMEKWLEKLGHSSIKKTETITAGTVLEAYKKRTQRIVEALEEITKSSSSTRETLWIRQGATLSSLSISDKEHLEGDSDGSLHRELLRERDLMMLVLNSGGTIRLIICPETNVERIHLAARLLILHQTRHA